MQALWRGGSGAFPNVQHIVPRLLSYQYAFCFVFLMFLRLLSTSCRTSHPVLPASCPFLSLGGVALALKMFVLRFLSAEGKQGDQ